MNFYPGQRVMCIDADGAPQLRVKAIYTIKDVKGPQAQRWRGDIRFGYNVLIHEADPTPPFYGFAEERFRALPERTTDISVFTAMLTGIKVDTDA